MSQVFIDIRTLSFVLMVVTGLMAGVMGIIWRTQKTYPGVGFWALSNLSAAFGFLFIGLRGVAPDLVTVLLGNFLAIGTMALAYGGNRSFVGLEDDHRTSFLVMAVTMAGIFAFTYIYPDILPRIFIASAATFIFSMLSFRVFLSAPKQRRTIVYTLVGYSHLVFALLMIVRTAATFSYSRLDQFFQPDWIQAIFFMVFIVFAIIWTFNYVVLNNERLHIDLRTAEAELLKLATTDHLTGIANTRAFFDAAETEIKRSRRHKIPLSLVLLDIDHFKRINDTHGHAAGDRVLRECSRLFSEITRQNDALGRIGGEEFAILLTHTDLARGRAVAESFRKAVEEMRIELGEEQLRLTASFGVAAFRPSDTLESFLQRADKNLYRAKELGRNRVATDAGEERLRLIS